MPRKPPNNLSAIVRQQTMQWLSRPGNTMSRLATLCRCSQSSLSRWLGDEVTPGGKRKTISFELASRLADVVGVVASVRKEGDK